MEPRDDVGRGSQKAGLVAVAGSRARAPVFAFLLPGLLSLFVALFVGLARLPWALPLPGQLYLLHGPLMVAGFLGTVIAAERAAAIARPWAWLAPLAAGIGALAMIVAALLPGSPFPNAVRVGAAGFSLGAVGLVVIFGLIIRRQPEVFNFVMGAGALCFLAGNLILLAGRPVSYAVLSWSCFLVLTIAGERLELNRFLRPRRMRALLFLIAAGALPAALIVGLTFLRAGDMIFGAAAVVLAGWLITGDIARRTIRMQGVTRFVAAALLSGYFWLGVAGLLALVHPGATGGLARDAGLHALYVGFVLSMIFGHAPIIVPALLGREVDYRAHFYAPLLILHASLLLRVLGDLLGWLDGRRYGGLLNVAALLLYLGVLIAAVLRARAARDRESAST